MEPEQNQTFTPNSQRENGATPPPPSASQQTPNPQSYGPGNVPPSSTQTFAGGPVQPPRSKKKLLAIIIVMVLLIGAGIAGSLLVDQKDQKENTNNSSDASKDKKTETVPSDWKPIDTALGFSVKAPAGWVASTPSEATVQNVVTKSATVGVEGGSADADSIILVSTQSLADKPGQEAFEASVTQFDADTLAALEQFGLKKEDVKVETERVTIAGKQWLQVDTSYPGQTSRTLYLWNGDHAIGLMVLSDKDDAVVRDANKYLWPMAASISIQ